MKKKDLILLCVFTSLICASWLFVIPLAFIPLVMQNAIVILTSAVLGYLGILSTMLFLLLGILGLPVFYGARSGIAAFLSPTGGYLLGYLLASILVAFMLKYLKDDKISLIFSLFCGFLIIYLPGIFWLKFSLELSLKEAILKGFLPFIFADIIKMIFLFPIILRLKKVIKR